MAGLPSGPLTRDQPSISRLNRRQTPPNPLVRRHRTDFSLPDLNVEGGFHGTPLELHRRVRVRGGESARGNGTKTRMLCRSFGAAPRRRCVHAAAEAPCRVRRLPVQAAALAGQARSADLNCQLHVGFDIAAPSQNLRVAAVHGDTPHSYLAGIPFTCEHQIRPDQLRGPSRIR